MSKFLEKFCIIFSIVFLVYLIFSGNLLAFDTKMIILYTAMFDFIKIKWLKLTTEIICFILLLISIFYKLHKICKNSLK